MLALNRGEQNKILTVKLTIPKHVENQFLAHLRKTWVPCDSPGSVNYGLSVCFSNYCKVWVPCDSPGCVNYGLPMCFSNYCKVWVPCDPPGSVNYG